MIHTDKWTLWLRWLAANAFGELLGLGITFAAIALVLSRLENQQSVGVVLLSFLLSVASGALEATLVGLSQWWAMHPWFPMITRRAWWLATLVGALIGYILGYLPSTLMSLGEQTPQAPMDEPPQWIVLPLAAGVGAIAGAVLSFAQCLVLRKKLNKPGGGFLLTCWPGWSACRSFSGGSTPLRRASRPYKPCYCWSASCA